MHTESHSHNETSSPPSDTAQAIAAEVLVALQSGQLDLPTLPAMTVKILNLIDDPDAASGKIANLLAADPAISMHIIRAANSAAYHNGNRVDNLPDAISRLGYRMLRSMVMNIAIFKLFQAKNPQINSQLGKLWEHSRTVAANSYVLARQHSHLKPEQAMLAGLVHDIGALPLYVFADRHHGRVNQTMLEGLIRRYATSIGTRLLQSWHFPADLIDVVGGHENLLRENHSGLADYVDVVTVANLQMPGTAKFVAWKSVRAAARLGFYVEDCQSFLANHADQLAAVKQMLGINAPQPA
ncbi:MAG TPA: HDOD domain-containing protein [Gallionella sp.]|nr:HDOD domain-containing protein [Gallionella sp.]